jgi:hypothetical protein
LELLKLAAVKALAELNNITSNIWHHLVVSSSCPTPLCPAPSCPSLTLTCPEPICPSLTLTCLEPICPTPSCMTSCLEAVFSCPDLCMIIREHGSIKASGPGPVQEWLTPSCPVPLCPMPTCLTLVCLTPTCPVAVCNFPDPCRSVSLHALRPVHESKCHCMLVVCPQCVECEKAKMS